MRDACSWLRKAIGYVLRKRIKLVKDLGQHLMICCSLGKHVCSELRRINAESVLEIGSGTGFLTAFILSCTNKVVAIELDHRLASLCEELLGNNPKLHVIVGDGLQVLRESSILGIDSVVSNTPFYISTPLIMSFIKSKYRYAVLTLQREVADRLVAEPGTREYGRLSVIVKLFAKAEVIRYFSRSCFMPKPEVDVALVRISKINAWIDEYTVFEKFLACAFSQRRRKASKVVLKCLNELGYQPDLVCKSLLDTLSDRRVFQLSPSEFWRIFVRCIRGS